MALYYCIKKYIVVKGSNNILKLDLDLDLHDYLKINFKLSSTFGPGNEQETIEYER